MNAIAQSRCVIEAILVDLGKSYKLDGGGISRIDQDSTWVYTVSIPQEERVDLITYTVEISQQGTVAIKDRKMSVESQDHTP
ncbi:MAG: hypothetical protein ABTQ34_05435 [Bdellovibrionales bacterium]